MLGMKALDEAKSARALEAIERSARAQAQLIDDLLDISRIVAGNLRLSGRWTRFGGRTRHTSSSP